jgi:hypothetical protein
VDDQRALEHHRRGTTDLPVQDDHSDRGHFPADQGIVEIVRCVICLREGDWPSREEDVEEVDVDKLKEMVHVKDEDIAKLDDIVVAEEARRP